VVADRLYRSRDDRMLAGVAGGLARVMDADPSIIRVVWVLVTFLSGGLALLVYIVMAIVVPEAPDGWDSQPHGGPTASAPREPVPPGGWVGPDGTVVPFAGTAPVADAPGSPGPTADGWTAPRSSGGGRRAWAIIGLILVLVGGAFLVRELMPAVDLSAVWPVLSIGFGIVLLFLALRPRRASD
jgi:phage shock protein C